MPVIAGAPWNPPSSGTPCSTWFAIILSTVAKDVGTALAYDHNMIGNILALSAISYGLGKFLMGSLSDRSDPRKFMASGLLLTGLVNFAFGGVGVYWIHLFLWSLNGFIQGMGWPPCGRSLGHWFSLKERGSVFAVWNVAHNIGGGLAGIMAAYAASHFGWQARFLLPGRYRGNRLSLPVLAPARHPSISGIASC